MKIHTITILLGVVVSLLTTTGCGGKTNPESSAGRLPWTRVKEVEVTSDTDTQGPSLQAMPKTNGTITAGASQSEVIMAWGVPDYIMDSQSDPERKIWQYSHAIVVFQGTKVEQILPR
ncbi:MAG: hypothetical protein GWP14_04695 [Actinobacteria bacterium]|nr:hypothetical protein [Actinomycetota bacterium]